MPNPPEANAAQAEHWNSGDAAHWVRDQDRYDRMLAPFADALLDHLGLTATEQVLDIGCGTGPTTCAVARAVSQGRVRGLDISRQMVEAARTRATQAGLTNVSFDVGDAQTERFVPETDVVMSRFGVMFFDDATAAFANLRTALAPGGRIGFVCWQDFLLNEWMTVPAVAALAHVPPPPTVPSDAPGPFSFGNPDRVRTILGDAGYTNVTIEPFTTAMLLAGGGSLDDATDFLRSTGMARALFAEASPEEIDRALAAVRAALEPFMTPEGVRIGAATWIVGARRN
jgi:SAM-dependent methyltransferase